MGQLFSKSSPSPPPPALSPTTHEQATASPTTLEPPLKPKGKGKGPGGKHSGANQVLPKCLADAAMKGMPPSFGSTTLVDRIAYFMRNVTLTTAAAAALRHDVLGERFARLVVKESGGERSIAACACPERREQRAGATVTTHVPSEYTNGSRSDAAQLGIAMRELQALYTAHLVDEAEGRAFFSSELKPGNSFLITLGEFDGNRDRKKMGRRDADRKWTIVRAREHSLHACTLFIAHTTSSTPSPTFFILLLLSSSNARTGQTKGRAAAARAQRLPIRARDTRAHLQPRARRLVFTLPFAARARGLLSADGRKERQSCVHSVA